MFFKTAAIGSAEIPADARYGAGTGDQDRGNGSPARRGKQHGAGCVVIGLAHHAVYLVPQRTLHLAELAATVRERLAAEYPSLTLGARFVRVSYSELGQC